MSADAAPATGPDLRKGVPLDDLEEGEPFFGHVDDSAVFLLRHGDGVRAFNAVCTHYGAPLEDGISTSDTIRCPWHHACFSLKDGSVVGGPAFNPLAPWEVEVEDGTVRVGERLDRDALEPAGAPERKPESVVIVGAGAAGSSAAETLRREGYVGPVSLIDPEPEAPYDRPNLSKDYLSGEAPEEWIPLRPRTFFEEHEIQRVTSRVEEIDAEGRFVVLEGGRTLPFGALILATGAVPRTLPIPGGELPHVHTLRSLADCRRIIEAAGKAERAVVLGASFIGMEVAASLRNREVDVAVVAPEEVPFEGTLGRDLGSFIRSLHEEEGVEFRLGTTAKEIRDGAVLLEDGTEVEADLVVVGVGVEPDVQLAENAGLELDDGVVVDEHLRSSHEAIWAAGDIAYYPEARLGHRVRIEHWVVARRQGRTAALNVLGRKEPFTDVPFFWTAHYGTPVAYLGHAPEWDEAKKEGECGEDGCAVTFLKDGRRRALGTVFRDRKSLEAEVEMEKEGEEAS
mgnify:CR=1 FL=1